MKCDNSIPAEARFTIAKERVLQLNDYCERGLRNVAAACQLWNRREVSNCFLPSGGKNSLYKPIAVASISSKVASLTKYIRYRWNILHLDR